VGGGLTTAVPPEPSPGPQPPGPERSGSPSPGLPSPGLPSAGPVLPRDFFGRPAQEVAPALLGCVLSHDTPAGAVAVLVTETEAYAGTADAASHAFRGRTARTAVMFGQPGHAYVYFTYGMHFCVNLVCLPEGTASAVLLRAGQVIEGAALAAERRMAAARGSGVGRGGTAGQGSGTGSGRAAGTGIRARDLARGPARLCQALGIDRALDGADVCDPDSALRVSGPVLAVTAADVHRGPRVGVSRAAEVPWRFWIAGDPTVSAYRGHAPRRAAAKAGSAPAPDGGTMRP
jgi:DNA-3-methyladenine glycosylase